MKIESIDFFYLSMPKVTTEADGSQDALLVRVAAGGLVVMESAKQLLFPPLQLWFAHYPMVPVNQYRILYLDKI